MMSAEELAQIAVAILNTTSALCLAPGAILQAIEFVRQFRKGDNLQPYRLVTVALFVGATVVLVWRAVLWLDLVFFAQVLFGPTSQRWAPDLTIGIACQVLFGYVAWVFWRDRWRTRRMKRERSRTS